MLLSSSGCRLLHEPLSAWKHPPENQCTKQHKFRYTVATVRHGWGGREELHTNLEPDVHVKNGGKTGLLPASSIPPETFPAAQSSIGIPATTFDWDSRSENYLRPASCLWPRTGNTIRVTWPVRCFWYGWSSYSAWRLQSAFGIRGSVIDWIQSFITNRSQTHHNAHRHITNFAGDVSTKSVVLRQRSGTHPVWFINCWCHKYRTAL